MSGMTIRWGMYSTFGSTVKHHARDARDLGIRAALGPSRGDFQNAKIDQERKQRRHVLILKSLRTLPVFTATQNSCHEPPWSLAMPGSISTWSIEHDGQSKRRLYLSHTVQSIERRERKMCFYGYRALARCFTTQVAPPGGFIDLPTPPSFCDLEIIRMPPESRLRARSYLQ